MRRWLILVHRYLGIGLCLLFVMWFVTGIAMIYARDMPRLTPDERLARRAPIDFSRIVLSPADAVRRAGIGSPAQAALLSVLGRPAYRFGPGRPVTIYADTGERLAPLDTQTTRAVAAAFLGLPDQDVRLDATLEAPDQWTLLDGRELPLHKFRANDEAATAVYVSPATAEIVLTTTRGSRTLAWISAIPHWLYFAPLRARGALWRDVVIGVSALASVGAIIGLALAVLQARVRYAGLLRWHYVTGAAFGVFAATWAFSGMLSMEPFFWAEGEAAGGGVPDALAGGPLDLTAFPAPNAGNWSTVLPADAIKEVRFARILGEPYYLVTQVGRQPLVVASAALQPRRAPFPTEAILARVRDGEPNALVAASDLLGDYDAYYYDRNHTAPLPVLRVKFGDPNATWIYVDPATSRVVASFTARRRLERWLYHGLHSLDFPFWYDRRPAWDAGLIVLLVGGTLLSGIGTVLGVRRVGRAFRRRRQYHAGIPGPHSM